MSPDTSVDNLTDYGDILHRKKPSETIRDDRIFIICEGLTEYNYFDCLQRYVPLKTKLFPIPKYGMDKNNSNRIDMTVIAEERIKSIVAGKYTPYIIAEIIFTALYEKQKFGDNKEARSDFEYRIWKSRDEVVGMIMENALEDDYVVNYIIDYIRHKYDSTFVLENRDECFKFDSKNENAANWRKWIVFDRDSNFVDEKGLAKPYNYAADIKTIKSKGFELLVTNPMFEFWLALNHDEIRKEDYLDFQKRHGKKGPGMRKKFNKWFSVFEPEMGKHLSKAIIDGRFRTFYHRSISFAITNSRRYCTDLAKLDEEWGTTVGIFIEQILSSSKKD